MQGFYEKGVCLQANAVCNVLHWINKYTVRKSLSKRKYVKAAELSGLVSEMVKSAGEAVIDMITDLGNQNIVRIVPAGCKLSTILN